MFGSNITLIGTDSFVRFFFLGGADLLVEDLFLFFVEVSNVKSTSSSLISVLILCPKGKLRVRDTNSILNENNEVSL
jgi:hypothetical protein